MKPRNTADLWFNFADQNLHKYNKLAMKWNLARLQQPLNIN